VSGPLIQPDSDDPIIVEMPGWRMRCLTPGASRAA
jgi:hypothetical protein